MGFWMVHPKCSQCGQDSGGYLCPLCLRPLCLDCSDGHTILCEDCRVEKFRHSANFEYVTQKDLLRFPRFDAMPAPVGDVPEGEGIAALRTVFDHLEDMEILSWESDYGDVKGALKVEPSGTIMVERPSNFSELLANALREAGSKEDA